MVLKSNGSANPAPSEGASLWRVGEDTEGRYALTEGIVPPHHGAPEHIHHREDEAFYILEGEFEIECGGEIFRAIRTAPEGSPAPGRDGPQGGRQGGGDRVP